jgi:non-hemolytic enterotoxin B/C
MPDTQYTETDGATQISSASVSQNSVGLKVQSYCESVLEQPEVDFAGFKNEKLKTSQQQVNAGLATAKDHATTYLRTIQPAIILNVSNISNYYALHNAIPATLPPGATTREWVEALQAMKDQADDFMRHSRDIAGMIGKFHGDLTTDVASFASVVSALNAVVNGDNGVLQDLERQSADIQGKIDGCIAGIVVSGLAIVGGAFMVAVGAIADFVTAGTTTPLIIAGVAVIAAGAGGEVAASLTLAGLQKAQASILTQKAQLAEEVRLAQGMSVGYASLRDGAREAVQAAGAMQNAWQYLSSDLGALSDDLEKGIKSTDVVRKLFLNAAGTVVKTVVVDTEIIKTQMTGVQNFTAQSGSKIYDFGPELARKAA